MQPTLINQALLQQNFSCLSLKLNLDQQADHRECSSQRPASSGDHPGLPGAPLHGRRWGVGRKGKGDCASPRTDRPEQCQEPTHGPCPPCAPTQSGMAGRWRRRRPLRGMAKQSPSKAATQVARRITVGVPSLGWLWLLYWKKQCHSMMDQP